MALYRGRRGAFRSGHERDERAGHLCGGQPRHPNRECDGGGELCEE